LFKQLLNVVHKCCAEIVLFTGRFNEKIELKRKSDPNKDYAEIEVAKEICSSKWLASLYATCLVHDIQ